MRGLVVLAIATMAVGSAAKAADLTYPGTTPPLPQQAHSATFLSELRLGVTAQDPTGPESGSANLTAEALSPKPCRRQPQSRSEYEFRLCGPDVDLRSDAGDLHRRQLWRFGSRWRDRSD